MTSTVDPVPDTAPQPVPLPRTITGRGPWVLAWHRLRHDKVAVASFVVIVLLVLLAL
jgi:peptide/nickel transport system permease protein